MPTSAGPASPPPRDRAPTWSRAASWAVGFLAAYAFFVLVQALLAYQAGLTEPRGVVRAVVRILLITVLTWALTQRQQWAWWAAMVASGLFALAGILGAIALGAAAISGVPAAADPLLPFGAVSVALLAGAEVSLIGAFCALVVGLRQHANANR